MFKDINSFFKVGNTLTFCVIIGLLFNKYVIHVFQPRNTQSQENRIFIFYI